LRARLEIYQLQGKVTSWWEEIKEVDGIDEQGIMWDDFQWHFKNKYLFV